MADPDLESYELKCRRAPAEFLEEIVLMCGKVAVDGEQNRVRATDLMLLRDMISVLRRHVAKAGYKTVPGLVHPKDDV